MIDNFDSFTYNLWHYIGELGVEVKVYRNNQVTPEEVLNKRPKGIFISPGPCTPNEAGICLPLIDLAFKSVPIFGVCLGHQCAGQCFGGKIVRAPIPMHGKVSKISHNGNNIFTGIPRDFKATRYHSLMIDSLLLPDKLEVIAKSEDGVIQGIAHKDFPIFGVQFHPESILSEHGHLILKNFIDITG